MNSVDEHLHRLADILDPVGRGLVSYDGLH